MDDKKARFMETTGEGGILAYPELDQDSIQQTIYPQATRPWLTVKPKNVDEVQRVVLAANETGIPLVPVSSGGPHLRGGTTPTIPDAIRVDLSGMKRILRVDRRNRLALIEPGVTFGELQPALQAEGLRLVAPLLPRRNKSVLAALLDREPVMSPKYQWNMSEPLRSLEIIWGNGDKFYTGSGTLRGEKDEDWQAGLAPAVGPGPGQIDFYKFISAAQGSMGIVTWASVKCEVYPEARKLYFFPAQRLEDLLDLTYQLLKLRFGDELFIVNNQCLASILGSRKVQIDGWKGKLPAWCLVVDISGGQILVAEKLAAQAADIVELAVQHSLQMLPDLPDLPGEQLLEIILHPSPEPYWKLRYKGGVREIFFLTTLDETPGFVRGMAELAQEEDYPLAELGVYLQPVQQGVGCHCEFILPFEGGNPAEEQKMAGLFSKASQRLFERGAYFSRPYGLWADLVYQADPLARELTRKLKEIFDPRHVMNPGKLCF